MASAKANEAAKAVNSLLHLSSSDFLAVVEDYFTSPDEHIDDFDVDGFDDSDTELGTDEPGTLLYSHNIHLCMHGHGIRTECRISVVHVYVEKCIMHGRTYKFQVLCMSKLGYMK